MSMDNKNNAPVKPIMGNTVMGLNEKLYSVPTCPSCGEPTYSECSCPFCGQPFVVEEGE
jgi:uncharacterized Zn finger protein (UPF0148 family)